MRYIQIFATLVFLSLWPVWIGLCTIVGTFLVAAMIIRAVYEALCLIARQSTIWLRATSFLFFIIFVSFEERASLPMHTFILRGLALIKDDFLAFDDWFPTVSVSLGTKGRTWEGIFTWTKL